MSKTIIAEFREYFLFSKDGFLIRKKELGGTTFIGQKVRGTPDRKGYLTFMLRQKSYKVHRAIFAIEYGYLPKEVDHKNRKRADNRIKNLRAANSALNTQNKSRYRNNTSGIAGIVRLPCGRYRARVWVGGEQINIGRSFNKAELEKKLLRFRRKKIRELSNELEKSRLLKKERKV